MKSVLMIAAATLALIGGGAHAQTTPPATAPETPWVYYAVPGGALGYEALPETDVSTGVVAGRTVTFFHIPQQQGDFAYTFQVEAMAIECRGQRYRVLSSQIFDASGKLLAYQPGRDWAPVPPNHPISIFKRVWCSNQRPPTAKEVPDREALFLAMRSLPITVSATPSPPPPPPPPAAPTPGAPATAAGGRAAMPPAPAPRP